MKGWRPRPAVRASIWAHAAAPLAVAAAPEAWPLVAGGLVANHALLGAVGMWPSSQLLGRTLCRLPPDPDGRVALTFDDGPDPDTTPAVLDRLDAHDARATFFCIGTQAARHPTLVRDIRRRGHAVGNHTQHHRNCFAMLGIAAQRQEILDAQAVLGATGPAPLLFRAPLGLRSPLLDPALHGTGLAHVSWTRRGYDTGVADPDRVLRRLLRGLADGDILLLHDGNAARDRAGQPVVLAVLDALLPRLARAGLRCVTLEEAWPGPVAHPVGHAAMPVLPAGPGIPA